MSNGIKWTGYLYMSLLSFSAFLLEYVSIFVIEGFFLHVDIWNYTPYQRSIHCIIMAVLWAAVIGSILLFSRRRYDFPVKNLDTEKISSRDWIAAFLCLAACKVMTFIDWHTWKIIGEAKGKKCIFFSDPISLLYIRGGACPTNYHVRAKSRGNRTEKRKQDSFWRYYPGINLGSFSFCFKGSRPGNMEWDFLHAVFGFGRNHVS